MGARSGSLGASHMHGLCYRGTLVRVLQNMKTEFFSFSQEIPFSTPFFDQFMSNSSEIINPMSSKHIHINFTLTNLSPLTFVIN